jgi:hypothetical protein
MFYHNAPCIHKKKSLYQNTCIYNVRDNDQGRNATYHGHTNLKCVFDLFLVAVAGLYNIQSHFIQYKKCYTSDTYCSQRSCMSLWKVAVQERQEKDSRVKIRMSQVHWDTLYTEFIHKGSQGHTNKLKHQVFTERKLDETSATHKHTPQKSRRHLKQDHQHKLP